MSDVQAGRPLRERLRAWWHNTDPLPITPGNPAPCNDLDADAARASDLESEGTAAAWSSERIAAGQIIWGDGSLSPRGDSQLRLFSAYAGLGRRSRVLHLGAELGGTAAHLTEDVGCHVVAAETLKPLAAASNGRVVFVRPGDAPLVDASDLVLADGLAERGEQLTKVLRRQCEALAPGGMVVLRSLVTADTSRITSERYRDWAAAEPVPPHLRTADELSRMLRTLGLSIVAANDISADYAAQVEYSWGDAIDRIRALHRTEPGQPLIATMLTEGERWLKRIELIREGIIGAHLIIAVRKNRGQ